MIKGLAEGEFEKKKEGGEFLIAKCHDSLNGKGNRKRCFQKYTSCSAKICSSKNNSSPNIFEHTLSEAVNSKSIKQKYVV